MRRFISIGGVMVAVLIAITFWLRTVVVMPGESYVGTLPEFTNEERTLADQLHHDIITFAEDIGERNPSYYPALTAAADSIDSILSVAGYRVERQSYQVADKLCQNIVAEKPGSGKSDEIIVIGAHYDSAPGTAGANDNTSGLAAMLALARMMNASSCDRTIRFVAFVNEEPPYFQTELMGSLVYARACRKRGDSIAAMLSLETMGYYSDQQGSQHYPAPLGLFYPSVGNFVGFASNRTSIDLLHQVIRLFREECRFPSEGAAGFEWLQGIGWSDHWSFWQAGYPAVMITDTAPFRYPYYHTPDDTPDMIDFQRLARVTIGLRSVITRMANNP